MVTSDASFWGFKEGLTAAIRGGQIHALGCDHSCNHYRRYATILTESGDLSGHYFQNRDCCNALARTVLQRVEECGIPASWH